MTILNTESDYDSGVPSAISSLCDNIEDLGLKFWKESSVVRKRGARAQRFFRGDSLK